MISILWHELACQHGNEGFLLIGQMDLTAFKDYCKGLLKDLCPSGPCSYINVGTDVPCLRGSSTSPSKITSPDVIFDSCTLLDTNDVLGLRSSSTLPSSPDVIFDSCTLLDTNDVLGLRSSSTLSSSPDVIFDSCILIDAD